MVHPSKGCDRKCCSGNGRRVIDDARWWRRAAIGGVLAFAVLRLATLTHYPPWTDEVWTFGILPESFRRLLRWFADDQTHPPLFYVLLWCWERIGGASLFWLRLFPSLIGCLTAVPLVWLCRAARLDRRATILAVAIGAMMPVLVAYSNEVRSYSLVVLLTAASLACWLRMREREAPPSAVGMLTVVNVLLVYTHFFGVLVVVAEWCDSLRPVRRRVGAMTWSGALTALSLVPWAAYVVHRGAITGHQLQVVDWIVRPKIPDIIEPYAWLLGGSPWFAADLAIVVAVGGAITLWLVRTRETAEGDAGISLLFAATIPVLITFVFSVIAPRSAWVLRYMIVIAAPLVVLVAATLTGLATRHPVVRITVPVAFALWVAGTAAQWIRMDNEKVHFDRIATAISARGGPAVVYSEEYVEGAPFQWIARSVAPSITVRMIRSVGAVPAESGWILWSEAHPPGGLPPPAALIRRGYRIGVPVFSLGMRDSVIALPFSRAVRP